MAGHVTFGRTRTPWCGGAGDDRVESAGVFKRPLSIDGVVRSVRLRCDLSDGPVTIEAVHGPRRHGEHRR